MTIRRTRRKRRFGNLVCKIDGRPLSEGHFTRLVQSYHNTLRTRLGYRTPAEIFRKHALPFKCESTFPLPRE